MDEGDKDIFLSPEESEAASDVDGKSNVYSLGVMLYWMLAGSRPARVSAAWAAALARMGRVLPSLPELRPELPLSMIQLLHDMQAMKGPERPSMLQVVNELERLIALG